MKEQLLKEQLYVNNLFADYDDSPEIKDFKEEITGNLKERMKELISKGFDEKQAFDKATAELGDITSIANEIGKKKRNEAIGQMYIKSKIPFTKKTAAGLTAASGLLLLGIGLILIACFGQIRNVWIYNLCVVMIAIAGAVYVYFGLTQETAAHYPMKNSRAIAYGCVCLFAFLGAGLAIVSFLLNKFELSVVLGIKITLLLPAICVLIFLLITESSRHKPWLKAIVEHDIENSIKFHMEMVNPVKAAKYGVASGGLWLLAIAIFATIGLLINWQYSWLVFLFALAIQVFMTTTIFENKK